MVPTMGQGVAEEGGMVRTIGTASSSRGGGARTGGKGLVEAGAIGSNHRRQVVDLAGVVRTIGEGLVD